MKVNIKALIHTLQGLENPTREEQRLNVEIHERFPSRPLAADQIEEEKSKPINYVTLTTVRYRHEYSTWYEWEIEI